MFRIYMIFAVFVLTSCKEENAEKGVMEKAVDSYGVAIEKAKETEAVLQKKADSIIRYTDSLGIPR